MPVDTFDLLFMLLAGGIICLWNPLGGLLGGTLRKVEIFADFLLLPPSNHGRFLLEVPSLSLSPSNVTQFELLILKLAGT